jgi:hypothetical protein
MLKKFQVSSSKFQVVLIWILDIRNWILNIEYLKIPNNQGFRNRDYKRSMRFSESPSLPQIHIP